MALISLRVDDDIIAAFRADGRGYQARMNQALRDSLLPAPPPAPLSELERLMGDVRDELEVELGHAVEELVRREFKRREPD